MNYQIIDSAQLAKRWGVLKTWVSSQVRTSAIDPIPHVKVGKYVRFEWESEALLKWRDARRKNQSPESAAEKVESATRKIEAPQERGSRLGREALSGR